MEEIIIKGESICSITKKKCHKEQVCKYCSVKMEYERKKKEKNNA